MLFADPSELRAATRLPPALQKSARPCPDLEKRTGADLLVSPLTIPATSDDLLRRHCQAGVLIQRKTGGDLAASIIDKRLEHDLVRMLEWTDRPWLVTVGTIENRNGKAFIDGRATMSYAAITGSLDWWQFRGGYLTQLVDDGSLINWIGAWLRKLESLEANPEKTIHRDPIQSIVLNPKTGMLMALPGLGEERSTTLLRAASNRLAKALEIITGQETYVEGIGPETRRAVREWLSMGEHERLAVVNERLLALTVQGCLELTGHKDVRVVEIAGALHSAAMHIAGLWNKGYRTEGWEAWLEDWCKDPLNGLSPQGDAKGDTPPF
jgi:ERCC4-type nuclease